MKRIGILQCDRVRPELIERHGDYPDMFRGLLEPQLRRPSGSTVSLPVFDVEHGRYPDDPADCYAYLITGSRAGVYDPEPWIRPLMGFARELHRRRIPVAGICFGHQLLAQALGGRAEKSAKGWGVGIRRVAVAAQRPWMQPPLAAFELIYSHQDQVTRLPPGARRLAGDTFCPNAMFELDRLVASAKAMAFARIPSPGAPRVQPRVRCGPAGSSRRPDRRRRDPGGAGVADRRARPRGGGPVVAFVSRYGVQ